MTKYLLWLLFFSSLGCQSQTSVQDGDIIFHTSKSPQSEAVQRATQSQYSHMGIILFRDGKPLVFEAVNPVKFTPLQEWIDRGKGKHYVVKRLKEAQTVIGASNLKKINDVANSFEGKPYDLTFEWSGEKIYCSELVWKIYQRALGLEVGKVERLRDFDLSEPVVAQKLKERYGSNVPLDETVVSPEAIFQSPHLVTVKRG